MGGLPSWEAVVRLSPADQAYLIGTLPLFRHTCLGAVQPTWSNSSLECAERLREDGMSGGAAWASTSVFGRMLLTLAMYVQVPTSLYDIVVGAREAELMLIDCFNSFHLAESRKRLRSIATPQVFRAVDSTWRLLDQMGLRMRYKVTIERTLLLDLNLHDSDDWELVGGPGKGGGGGGGGIAIPVDAPLGATPQGAQPPSSSTMRAQVPPSGPSNPAGGATGSKAKAASGDRKPTDRAVRYADLDVQYCTLETMELWSVRPDQTMNGEGDKAATAGAGATTATTAGAPGAQGTFVPPQSDADDAVERMASRIDALYEAEKTARGKDGANPAVLEQQLKRMQDAVSGVDSSAGSFAPLMSHGGVAAVAAPAAGATAAAATAAAPSAAGAAAASALPADGDWPAPVAMLSTISGEAERGLRFYSDLPARQVESPGEGLLWTKPELEDPTPVPAALKWVQEKAIEMMRVPSNVHKFPKANWIIKDIID